MLFQKRVVWTKLDIYVLLQSDPFLIYNLSPVTRLIRRVALVEQELSTLAEHINSLLYLIGFVLLYV